jgi:SAM-dependent methyltransferase
VQLRAHLSSTKRVRPDRQKPDGYRANRVRGAVNAFGFTVLDRYFNRLLQRQKLRVFAGLPDEVVELGSGVGANFRYLRHGTRVIAIEPNPAMHAGLRARAKKHDIDLELRGIAGERLDLADSSVDAVISSLVLCTVTDPARVVAEVLRVLRPGGRYAFVEHVAAPAGTRLRRLQRVIRRPWAWCFEGCSCERNVRSVIEQAGFADVQIEDFRIRSVFLPINTQIAGRVTKSAS